MNQFGVSYFELLGKIKGIKKKQNKKKPRRKRYSTYIQIEEVNIRDYEDAGNGEPRLCVAWWGKKYRTKNILKFADQLYVISAIYIYTTYKKGNGNGG